MIEKSLSKLSYDKSNKFIVCNYDNVFIDLDDSKGILQKAQSPNSPDMLYINDEKKEMWFVEFKSSNQKSLDATKEKVKLRKKIFAGLFLTYELFCEKSCNYKDYDKFYFITYNKEQKTSFEDELLNDFDSSSQRNIEFGLEDLRPQFVKDIFTEDCEELKKLFQKRFNIVFKKDLQ
ncbi:MAG: hypothetical protein WCW84_03990 [Sulfurimonas sp.]|jgi:hypothetical protein